MNKEKPILIVDDDIVDIMTIRRAFKEITVANPTVAKSNGEEALEYLNDTDTKDPCIVLLDLNMPKINGLELLKSIKCDLKLKRISVILFTTSLEEIDILKGFRLGIAGYFIKPAVPTKFNDLMRVINDY